MLDESLGHNDETKDGNVENNKPVSLISNNDGANLNKTRQVLLKKAGKKLRATPSCPQRATPSCPQRATHQRNNPARLTDHNNNNVAPSPGAKTTAQPSAESPTSTQTSTQTGPTLHHKLGTKKELLKSKSGRLERGATQQGGQPVRILSRHDQITQNLNGRGNKGRQTNTPGVSQSAKGQDHGNQQKPSSLHQPQVREQKKPLSSADNVKIVKVSLAEPVPEDLHDGEKVYAGAKFSEPPSPSVLPKPPSHWVGENGPQHCDNSREQMTVHLKSLLKVQGKS
ncbi:proline-rich nuclear receptor coactivator 1 [Polymixia lowei]